MDTKTAPPGDTGSKLSAGAELASHHDPLDGHVQGVNGHASAEKQPPTESQPRLPWRFARSISRNLIATIAHPKATAEALPAKLAQLDSLIGSARYDLGSKLALEAEHRFGRDPFLAIRIARLALAQGSPARALEYAESAAKGAPDNGPLLCTYSEILTAVGSSADAFQTLAGFFFRTGELLAGHLIAAMEAVDPKLITAEDRARLQEVIRAVEEKTSAGGGTAVSTMAGVAGELAHKLGEHETAARLVAQSDQAISGTQPNAHALLRSLAEGDITVSIEQADALVNALPSAAPTLQVIARTLHGRGHNELALRLWSGLIESGSATEDSYYMVALLKQTRSPAEALDVVNRGLKQFPQSSLLRIERAKLYVQAGTPSAALSDATAAYEARPDLLDIALEYIHILRLNERFDAMAQVAEAVLQRHPNEGRAHLVASEAAARAGSGREALEHAETACKLQPTNRDAIRIFVQSAMSEEAMLLQAEARLQPFMADEADDQLIELMVVLLLKLIWPNIPSYADEEEERIGRLVALVSDNIGVLSSDVLWDALRFMSRLRRYDDAASILSHLLERNEIWPAPSRSAAMFVSEISQVDATALGDGDAPEAVGRALVHAGLRAHATNHFARAQMIFRIAAAMAPEDMSARINGAFAELENGAVSSAWRHLQAVSRVYHSDMDDVVWPKFGRTRWPRAAGPYTAAFEALKPKDQEWPLITVITPSLNQVDFVEETLLSVLNQRYPRLQYIVVDGLSDDGSIDIINRYRDAIDTVIVEKDSGQTEAINKGLRLAKGEIIGWVNSDDMLGPGALHAIALTHMRSRADLIYGICMVHRDYHFNLANLPEARQETFTLSHLGDMFRYWLKGFFFYQPEVFFTRRVLEICGPQLDENLHYTMDYEFWLRCAKAGARVEAVHWPVAFFRQHEQQKTANLLDCMLEQAQVRDRFIHIAPAVSRRLEVRSKLADALTPRQRRLGTVGARLSKLLSAGTGSVAAPRVRLGIISSRLPKIFSRDMADELQAEFSSSRFEPTFVQSAEQLPEVDLVLKLIHLQHDIEEIDRLRRTVKGPIVGWFWDNHHHLFANYDVAKALDVVIPGHAFASSYLHNDGAVALPPAPLCVTQWSRREAEQFFAAYRGRDRKDALYGGFIRYGFAKRRNELIEKLVAAGCDSVSFLEEGNLKLYFDRGPAERFEEWMQHKVSLCLPLDKDLSQRFFDALLAGQVPIVAPDIEDLDAVVPPALQQTLPVIRSKSYSVQDIIEAHEAALAAFESAGQEGVVRRHRFALEHHTFTARMHDLVAQLEVLADRL